MTENCEGCRFARAHNDGFGAHLTQYLCCHYWPPRGTERWPSVGRDDWCGHFEFKGEA